MCKRSKNCSIKIIDKDKVGDKVLSFVAHYGIAVCGHVWPFMVLCGFVWYFLPLLLVVLWL